jgi:hypothetical protein
VEELERQLLEWEELEDIKHHQELEVLSTHESALNRHGANLDTGRKALEDAHAQVLARELDADSWEADLRDQEARLVVRERQFMEWRM